MKPQCGVTRAQQNGGGGGGRYVVIKHTKMKRGGKSVRTVRVYVHGSAHTVEKRGENQGQ